MIRKKLTTKEAAEILGLSESTLRGRKAGTHVLSRTKHGRVTRFFRDEVEALAEGKTMRFRHRQPAPSQTILRPSH